jgi:hypothetical protein
MTRAEARTEVTLGMQLIASLGYWGGYYGLYFGQSSVRTSKKQTV